MYVNTEAIKQLQGLYLCCCWGLLEAWKGLSSSKSLLSYYSVTYGKGFHSVSATMKPCTLTYCCWLSRISPAYLTPSPPVLLGSPLTLISQLSPTLILLLLPIFSIVAPQGRSVYCSWLPPLIITVEGPSRTDTHTHIQGKSTGKD